MLTARSGALGGGGAKEREIRRASLAASHPQKAVWKRTVYFYIAEVARFLYHILCQRLCSNFLT